MDLRMAWLVVNSMRSEQVSTPVNNVVWTYITLYGLT